MTLWIENLQRLVSLIEGHMAEIDSALPPNGTTTWSHDDWKKHDAGVDKIISGLKTGEGARIKDGSECRLVLAGVSVTCTSGHHGVLRNWMNAARKKIAADDGFNPHGSGPVLIEPREA
ncbi:hypothetical protein NKI98_17755 [Mesorhizobium sp. M0222]|uniref:hypothetical protein n=1 Tax=Mesorhizobium sp. M0222 TaxID=2956921 RepID=UPI00333D7EDA